MKKIIFDKENKKRPYLAVAGVLIKKIDNQEFILLGKRKNIAGHGYYYLPSGHVFEGETNKKALIREIKEELSVKVKILQPLFCLDDILVNEGQYWLVPFYLCQIEKGEPVNQEPEKIEKIAWFSLDSLPKNLALGTKEALEKLNEDDFLPNQKSR